MLLVHKCMPACAQLVLLMHALADPKWANMEFALCPAIQWLVYHVPSWLG